MKKLIYAICMGAAVAFSSCEDMLDTTNYTEKTTATFPESYDDAQQMIAGVLRQHGIRLRQPREIVPLLRPTSQR